MDNLQSASMSQNSSEKAVRFADEDTLINQINNNNNISNELNNNSNNNAEIDIDNNENPKIEEEMNKEHLKHEITKVDFSTKDVLQRRLTDTAKQKKVIRSSKKSTTIKLESAKHYSNPNIETILPHKAINNPLIESLYNQIEVSMTALDHKIVDSLNNKESNLMCAFKNIMKNMNDQIQELRNLLAESHLKYNEDYGEQGTIPKQLEFFRQQSIFYSQKLLEIEKKLNLTKQHAEYLNFELKREHEALISEAQKKKKLENFVENIYSLTSRDRKHSVKSILDNSSIDPQIIKVDSLQTVSKNLSRLNLKTEASPNKDVKESVNINDMNAFLNFSSMLIEADHQDLTDIQKSTSSPSKINLENGDLRKYSHSANKLRNNSQIIKEPNSSRNGSSSPFGQKSKVTQSKYSIKNVDVSFLKDNILRILKDYTINEDIMDDLSTKIVDLIEMSIKVKNQEIAKLHKLLNNLNKEKNDIIRNQNFLCDATMASSLIPKDEILRIFLNYLKEYQRYNSNSGGVLTDSAKKDEPIKDLLNNEHLNLSKWRSVSKLTKINLMEKFFNDSKVNEILRYKNEDYAEGKNKSSRLMNIYQIFDQNSEKNDDSFNFPQIMQNSKNVKIYSAINKNNKLDKQVLNGLNKSKYFSEYSSSEPSVFTKEEAKISAKNPTSIQSISKFNPRTEQYNSSLKANDNWNSGISKKTRSILNSSPFSMPKNTSNPTSYTLLNKRPTFNQMDSQGFANFKKTQVNKTFDSGNTSKRDLSAKETTLKSNFPMKILNDSFNEKFINLRKDDDLALSRFENLANIQVRSVSLKEKQKRYHKSNVFSLDRNLSKKTD